MRYTIGVMLVLGLSGCVQETYYQGGVGFGTYEEYLAAREQREAALAGQTVQIEQTVLPPADAKKTPEEVQMADASTTAIQPAEPLSATAPLVVDNPGISDEQDFDAVSSRETIESDRERLQAKREAYVQIEPTELPTRTKSDRPNIVSFALETTNSVGEQRYRRSGLRGQAGSERACAKFTSSDLAQEAFLSAGGPERDRRNLDPDGDGFACGWDPRPFRLAVQ